MRLISENDIAEGGQPLAFSQQHIDSALRRHTDYRVTHIDQNDVTSSRAINGTVYQNTSGKIMLVTVAVEAGLPTSP